MDVETLLHKLVACETVSALTNADLRDVVLSYLESFGVTARIFPDATGTKFAILATIGDPRQPGIVLSAHTDVVPATGQVWTSPPFAATTVGDRIVGRGTSDMKGFIAAVLASVPDFLACCDATPVHIALSYDEEVGCRGAGDLVAALAALPAPPALCLVGEPTRLRVGRAHKGKVARQVTIRGRSGHSAMPHRAASALDAAVSIAARLREHAEALALTMPGSGFDPPYPTLHIGSIASGGALNLVPDCAALAYEIRSPPDTDVATTLAAIDAFVEETAAALRAKAPEAGITVTETISYPPLAVAVDHPALAAVAAWARDGGSPVPVSFGTEGGLYAAAGIPTAICGPGDIARAHKADEWIGRGELADACAMLRRLAETCRRPASAWLRSAARGT